MLMSVYALLLANSKPTAEEVREAISGNLCRCTSYAEIVEAVLSVADGVEPVLRTEVLDAK
jgi:aerobic-type carbon monoxide dehydrogenase small subunit (CoxS/CutS family)